MTSAECSGSTPICNTLGGNCVACSHDFSLLGVLTGSCSSTHPVCETSGPSAGSCAQCSATNAGACTGNAALPICIASVNACGCAQDNECGQGAVCDTASGSAGQCVVGCKVTVLGQNPCLVGAHCSVSLLGAIGLCVANPVGSSAPTCAQDSDCATGLVCDAQADGGLACVAGCHVSALGDSCLVGAHCSVLGVAHFGICVGNLDAGAGVDAGPGIPDASVDAAPPACTSDAQCASGQVCDSANGAPNACVVGCHATVLGDTCLIGARCSLVGARWQLSCAEFRGAFPPTPPRLFLKGGSKRGGAGGNAPHVSPCLRTLREGGKGAPPPPKAAPKPRDARGA